MSNPYVEPECYWCRQCTSGRCVFHNVGNIASPHDSRHDNMITGLVKIDARMKSMSVLSDFFDDGSLLDKLQQPPQYTIAPDSKAEQLLKSIPIDSIDECIYAFWQWYDEYRIGYNAESASIVRAWLEEVKREIGKA